MTAQKSNRMYPFSREQKNLQVNCEFGCIYCAFQKLTHRFNKCLDRKSYIPHYHLERLKMNPKKTVGKELISLCPNGDVSFVSAEFIQILIKYCEQCHNRMFLIQSKNLARLLCFEFPYNVILGTNIETNYKAKGRDNVLYSSILKAPLLEERCRAIRQVQKNNVHITIEPIMDFYLDELVSWMKNIPRLKLINIGYDSHPNHLPEPSFVKTLALIERLKGFKEVRINLGRQTVGNCIKRRCLLMSDNINFKLNKLFKLINL